MRMLFPPCFLHLLGLAVLAYNQEYPVDADRHSQLTGCKVQRDNTVPLSSSGCGTAENYESTWEEMEERRGENVALRGKATLSDLYGNGFAYNAIDGNQDGVYDHGSCAHTKFHFTPWWRVNLLKKYKVFSVIITTEVSTPERLDGAEIRIGNSLVNNGIDNPRCDTITSIPSGFSVTYDCNGMVGRYVTIVIPGRIEYLILCEVEVYGLPLD